MADRDPRIDPRPGDVVRSRPSLYHSGGATFRVREVYGDHVAYQQDGSEALLQIPLIDWREYAEADEVLEVAGA